MTATKADTVKKDEEKEVVKKPRAARKVPPAEVAEDAKKVDEETDEEVDGELKPKKETAMGRLFATIPTPPGVGDLVEGSVISIDRAAVYVNLPPYGTGIIFGREFMGARDIIKKIGIGDIVSAKVVDTNNEDGYIELSLKEAKQALIWSEAQDAIRDRKVFELPVTEANKGGLIINWQGIQGFLPASQLKVEHYPRVTDGDKDKILEELKKLVGQKIQLSIISAVPKEGKLIFSEKNLEIKDKEKLISNYKVGDEVTGEVTGIVDFGVFVKIEDGLEGLVHISEIDWALVEDPKLLFKVGERIQVKIIEIKDDKVSLSIKALKPSPWVEAGKNYKKGDTVSGVIIKYNKHGALASIEEGVAGLIHISEFGTEDKLRATLELGKTYSFKITLFDAKEEKMALSYVEANRK